MSELSTNDHPWIDQEFLTTALRSGESDPQLEVVKYHVYKGTNTGDNYVSVVYRGTVETKTCKGQKEYKVVIKCIPLNEVRRNLIDGMGLFLREIKMYELVIPEFIKLQKRKCGKEILSSIAHCYYSVLGTENDCIVLDDLAPLGFKMANRQKGLDYLHCRLVLSELGKFHGISYALKNEGLEGFKEKLSCFENTIYVKEKKEKYTPFICNQIDLALSTVKSSAQYDKIVQKCEKLKEVIYDLLVKVNTPIEPVVVLLHGDCWVNNMLFTYEKQGNLEVPLRIKFLDYQISRFGSPALDLVYFLYTSTTKELREKHLQELLHLYYDNFAHTVEQLGSNMGEFTFQILQEELKKKLIFGFTTACSILPLVMSEPDKAPKFDNVTEEDLKNPNADLLKSAYENKELEKRFGDILIELDSQNVFGV